MIKFPVTILKSVEKIVNGTPEIFVSTSNTHYTIDNGHNIGSVRFLLGKQRLVFINKDLDRETRLIGFTQIMLA